VIGLVTLFVLFVFSFEKNRPNILIIYTIILCLYYYLNLYFIYHLLTAKLNGVCFEIGHYNRSMCDHFLIAYQQKSNAVHHLGFPPFLEFLFWYCQLCHFFSYKNHLIKEVSIFFLHLHPKEIYLDFLAFLTFLTFLTLTLTLTWI